MAYSEDHIALAAEYALGTLDAGERAQVETMMAVDTDFTAVVHAWEYRLGVLNQMVGTIEPRPIVWENIRSEIARTAHAQEPHAQEPPLPEADSQHVAPCRDASVVCRLRSWVLLKHRHRGPREVARKFLENSGSCV